MLQRLWIALLSMTLLVSGHTQINRYVVSPLEHTKFTRSSHIQMCLLDTFSASPSGHLSTSQLETYRLFHELSTGETLPSVRQLKHHRDVVVLNAGSDTTERTSSHGNTYSMNSLKTIITHVGDLAVVGYCN
jgi:hypothetical protein